MQEAATAPSSVNAVQLEPLNRNVRAARVAEAIATYRLHDADVGSPEAQVAKLSVKIDMLTKHLQENPKDFSSTRGLLKMVATRKRLLNYLKNEDPDRFEKLVGALGIRLSKDMSFAAKTIKMDD